MIKLIYVFLLLTYKYIYLLIQILYLNYFVIWLKDKQWYTFTLPIY